jgi:hypothetical protein
MQGFICTSSAVAKGTDRDSWQAYRPSGKLTILSLFRFPHPTPNYGTLGQVFSIFGHPIAPGSHSKLPQRGLSASRARKTDPVPFLFMPAIHICPESKYPPIGMEEIKYCPK